MSVDAGRPPDRVNPAQGTAGVRPTGDKRKHPGEQEQREEEQRDTVEIAGSQDAAEDQAVPEEPREAEEDDGEPRLDITA